MGVQGRIDLDVEIGGGGKDVEHRPVQRFPFQAPVQHGVQVGQCQVDHLGLGIGRGRDRGRIGRPHAAGRIGRLQVLRAEPRRRVDHGRDIRAVAEIGEEGQPGARLGRQHALCQPRTHHHAHLFKALQRRLARIGDIAGILRAGEIAVRQAAIIVGRPDQAVEIDLDCPAHRGKPWAERRTAVSETWLACGQAQ